MDKTIVYKGWLREGDYGDAYDIVLLNDRPLADLVQADMDDDGNFLSVRYFVSPEEKTIDELTEDFVKSMSGVGKANYWDVYSEITGYLWTEEELQVGGHDLLLELETFALHEYYLWMEIIFHTD